MDGFPYQNEKKKKVCLFSATFSLPYFKAHFISGQSPSSSSSSSKFSCSTYSYPNWLPLPSWLLLYLHACFSSSYSFLYEKVDTEDSDKTKSAPRIAQDNYRQVSTNSIRQRCGFKIIFPPFFLFVCAQDHQG